MAMIGVTGSVTTAYAAGNISDTYYALRLSQNGSSAYTEARPKYNDTSAYMKFLSIQDGAGAFTMKVVDQNNKDFSVTFPPVGPFHEYTPYGTEKWIKNWAYEDRGYGVKVKLKATGSGGAVSGGVWVTEGLWSPDSVGGY